MNDFKSCQKLAEHRKDHPSVTAAISNIRTNDGKMTSYPFTDLKVNEKWVALETKSSN